MPVTIDDVAKHAAVSIATVSRALRGLPNVAPDTRRHVLEVAKELNYMVAPQATRALTGRKVVAIITPLVDQWFYSKVATVAAFDLLSAGVEPIRYFADSVEAQTALIKQLLQQQLIDGCIVVSFHLESEATEALLAYNVPAVTLETSTVQFPSIMIDNVAAAELATRHLINLGHHRIGLVLGSMNVTRQDFIPTARHKGYRTALKQAGIKYDSKLELSGNDVYEGGAEAMKQFFSLHEPPTAVFAASDEMAIGVLKTLRDLKLRVPEDVSVIGFDDNDIAAYADLTTIRQPVSSYGELAAEQMIACLKGECHKARRVLAFELIIRSTTGPAKHSSR
jgi:DNA-binding LacI/PurR family transcriptional regulator